ncbi:hypothetical protein EYS14_05295 [Alteromonadaceae bacterium M269]|nr:hypothetical protein EYS14_05295 [Alteromonadaceae bacterium M269]
MMILPVFLHVAASPRLSREQEFHCYLQQVRHIIQQYGGVCIATYDVEHVVGDTDGPAVFIVFSLPSRDAIERLFAEHNEETLEPLRDSAFGQLNFYVTSETL